MPLSLTVGLHNALQRHPEKLATIFGPRQHTYRQYGERVARLASALQQLGMAPGDRVAMLALNSDRYLECFYGTWWGGGAVNPANIRWSAPEVAYSLEDCDSRILIVDDQFKGMVPELLQRCPCVKTVIYCGDGELPAGMLHYEQLLAAAAPVEDAGRLGNDLAGIFYTGGTTGFPKGVMLSHDNLAANALAILAAGVIDGDSRTLLIAPMFHLAAGAAMNATAMAGGTFVMAPMFTPLGALQVIQEHRPTSALLVPTMIQLTVDHPDVDQYDLSSVRLVLYGASVINEAVLERAMARFPNAGFTQAYGMTELSPVATILNARDHAEGRAAGLLRSAGRACTVAQVRIVDADGKEVPRGTVGEVAVRGASVMLGYWNKPDLTTAALRNGWMHTGDGGRMDEQGYVYIVDRIKDMIVTGGENVYSAEVENALAQHPAVAACAVIGIPSDQWGEAVHAAVVLKPGSDVTTEALVAFCHDRIAKYKCPRSVEFRASLPMTGAGKVQKTALREPFWEGRDRQVG